MGGRARWIRVAAAVTAMAMIAEMLPTASAADPLGGAASSTLAREPQLTPDELGDGSVSGLQFPDPTEGLAIVEPPTVSNDGGAHLSYPLLIPKGRGITPELSIDYDSGGDDGWIGLGWNLSVGDVSVDTRWGAPYFDPNKESETYSLDGDMLIPNALGDSWADRVHGDRQDYTRQVETEYQQIIRHEVDNEGTKGYFWEVHDKGGNVFWYGGRPDQGGPDGYNYLDGDPATDLTPTIDRSAIVTDEHGNQVQWLLSAQRDVGVNQISYHYTTIHYQFGGAGWVKVDDCTPTDTVLCAKHTYLSSIDYTEAADVAPAPNGDAAYRIVFERESDVRPGAALRADPTVDAMGGYVDLTIDRLARVEVLHAGYQVTGTDADGNETRAPRTYDQLAVAYDLTYKTGAFGKSLLDAVAQVGSDGTTTATHTFSYYDRVSTATGYDGFDSTVADWHTGSDLPDRHLLDSQAAIGALGASESNSGEGHAYVGFNPIVPEKVGSFGGSLQIGGGATEALSEWLDINGDGLPDKVYRDPDGNDIDRNGPIWYRLNTSGPHADAEPTFADPVKAVGITRLSTEGNFGVEGAFEAFPGATVAFGLGAEVSWGDAYFSDVNGDGLPDYVSGGKVFFNHLDGGVATFVEGDSGSTDVPILDASATVDVPEVNDLQDQLNRKNPLVDTVRRWTAPFTGTVSIDAQVTLDPPATSSGDDGVRVAIQHEDNEIATANLQSAGATAFGAPITRDVVAGEDIYFRVGSVKDGAHDEVAWSPTITYTAIDGVADLSTVPPDVNGLSQLSYVADDDFTLSGRPDTRVFMPFAGMIHFSATVDKLQTTDDVQVVLLHNGAPVAISDSSFTAGFSGERTLSADFAVAAPVQPDEDHPDVTPSQDSLTVKLVTDTPIDLHAISWNPHIAYTSATDRDGQPKDLSKGPVAFDMTPEIEQYPFDSTTAVSTPWSPASDMTRDAKVTFARAADSPAGQAVVVVKTRTGVVARKTVDVPASPLIGIPYTADVDLNVSLDHTTDYWIDVTIRDAALSDKVSMSGFVFTDGTPANDVSAPAVLHWTGRQGIFPLPYRGWAVAGYNGNDDRATHAIVQTDFDINIHDSNKPTEPADPGFGDIGNSDPAQDTSFAYLPAVQLVTLPGVPTPLPTDVWMGQRPNLAATAQRASSSRLGSDTASLGSGASGGAGRAVTRVSITAPSVKLAFGIGPAGASFGVSPSFGLVDYEDMNGDGYPDIITPSSVTYTTQRGGYQGSGQNPGDLAVTNQDLTFSVSAGIESGLVDIKANAKGKTNATKGGAAGKGSDAEDSGGGVGIGVSFDASWTSPNASGPADSPVNGTVSDPTASYSDQLDQSSSELPGTAGAIQQGLADVNGDGLPDRVFTTPSGTFARYNLGYDFTAPVKLASGGFESQESYAGGLSLGFSTPWADFSGGVALNWNVDLSRYAWADVNGDGILDQLHKINNSDPPTVRFGTGTGVLDPVVYGNMASSNIQGIDAGQQVSLDRTDGLGGQFDFTIAIGPLCLVACYLIINPGASYQNSISSTEVDLQDVNGDGYADSVQTLDDNSLQVRVNKQADTNLLATVTNPLNGTITMTYGRDGNTVAHPDSVWNMASVEVDDGRPGDGPQVRRTTFAYSGLAFDRLHREDLGYSTATETEVDTDTAANYRTTTHTYLNDSVFDAGLETTTLVTDPNSGDYINGARQTWVLRDVRGGADLGDLHSTASLGYSIAPLMTKVVSEVGNGSLADPPGESSTTEFTYDALGDTVTQVDRGEDDDPNDDVVADIIYSRCDISSTIGCAGDQPHDRPAPYWDANLCPTWVSLPAVITITNGKSGADRVIYRHRDGRGALCDNASVTHLEEDLGGGQVAETELTYDAWGSYDRIVYPMAENGRRYSVQYVWDLDGHANIADVTEYDLDPSAVDDFLGDGLQPGDTYTEGLRSTATFDPLSGRVASRTDANGNTTSYTYDALGRLASSSSPVPGDPALVTYEYRLSSVAAPTASAVAHHFDTFHPGDTIDTATFVDGTGRVVQTQNDASLFTAAGQPSHAGTIVSGRTVYDAFGRPVDQYNPTESTKSFGVYEDTATDTTQPHTNTVYDLWDLANVITEPGDRVTNVSYSYGRVNSSDPQIYMTTETAPNGRRTVTYTDVRDVVRAVDDVPVGAADSGSPDFTPQCPDTTMVNCARTRYLSDGMGQLLQVTDPQGNLTTHTYDLMGRRTSTTTPDAGTVTFSYDADGQQTGRQTPNLRANNQQVNYHYQLHRLTNVDYPGTADDVTYTYGAAGAPDNGAGQVVLTEDGSRIQRNKYDPAGNIVQQTTTMKLHAWTPTADQSKFTWTTSWTYDGLGRLKQLVYPDSERLAYDYDAGGQVKSISGQEDGYKTIQVGVDPVTGQPIYQQIPWTWQYRYLDDRQYDQFLRRRYDVLGNQATTELSFDPNTQWLTRLQTISPNRDTKNQGAVYQEIQDLSYTYDHAGNPTTYRNDVPAPVSNLFSGPTEESYTYDGYERVVAGRGSWQMSTDKLRHYELALAYDRNGNVISKSQNDRIRQGKKELTQTATTYSFTRSYAQSAPHQATQVGTGSARQPYSYDLNGNLTGIKDAKGKYIRAITWDSADRMRTVTDGPSLTEYNYDDSGQRSIERGPSGETATLNPWVTVRNTTDMYKHIWAGDDRIGTQRDNGGNQELQQYFLHKDLQGSTNVVTDITGNTFQHHEYFATGEVWVDEKSTVFRTPFQFGGGYVDEVRAIINFGARWYDQDREMFYSPDPVLVDDPAAIVGTPQLRTAYAFAGSNPLAYVDPHGKQFTRAQAKAFIKANQKEARAIIAKDPALRASLAKNLQTRLPRSLVKLGLDVESAELHQKRFEMIDDVAKPFVEINVSTGEVKLSPGLFKQFTVRKGKKDDTQAAGQPAGNGAANGAGGPVANAGGNGATQDQDKPKLTAVPKVGAPSDSASVPAPEAKRISPKPLPKPPIAGNDVKGDL